MNVSAMVKSRMGSSSLPGKILEKLNTRTFLETVVHRLSFVKTVNEVVILTTIEKEDLPKIGLCAQLGFIIFTGLTNDVLWVYMVRSTRTWGEAMAVAIRFTRTAANTAKKYTHTNNVIEACTEATVHSFSETALGGPKCHSGFQRLA